MQENPKHAASIWFFYFVAATLGISFLVTLLFLAWGNVVEREIQKFAYESLSIDDAVRTNVHAANDGVESLAALIQAVPDLTDTQLAAYAQDLISRYEFIAEIGVYERNGEAEFRRRFARARGTPGTHLPELVSLSTQNTVAVGFASVLEEAAPIPTGHIVDDDPNSGYLVLKSVAESLPSVARLRVVAFLIDPVALFGSAVERPHMSVRLYSESEGVGGRQLLYERIAAKSKRQYSIDTLEESTQIRFDRYSMRLIATRDTYWDDLDKGLLFTGLVLGAGVTLLLIALARAKELQTRELRERNREIEEQVARQTQELALARDQALEASRVKSDFLASMSHEIRTPLNAIIGMAELLSDTNLSADQANYVGVFKNAGEALLSLVNDILDLSKIEAEQLVLEQIDFDVRDLVEQSADIYALKTAAKNLELAVHVGANVPAVLQGDPSRLRQIILNLIGNAIKFTEEGEIILQVQLLDHTETRSRLSFAVRDSGIGIPAGKLESIFGSFTQVDSSTTRKFGGTGLGLTISKKLVEMMGGRIWVESIEGSGSTFKFEVEFANGAAPAEQALAGSVSLAGTSVLVVDDSDTNRLILREALVADRAEVVEASSGEAALAAYAERLKAGRAFDVVLCDVQMPGMDGFDVIQRVIELGGSVKTVMMLTSSNLSEDLERAKAFGLGAYLVKPIKRDDLRQAMKRVIESAVGTIDEHKLSAANSESTRHALLLVEDNPDNRLLIKAYLKKEPFDIDEAENGEQGVALFKSKRYDLVLMDVQMPVMDGHAATKAIRAFEGERASDPVPVIALTAHAIKEDMERSLKAGCTAHLTKPIKKKTLLSALSEYLD